MIEVKRTITEAPLSTGSHVSSYLSNITQSVHVGAYTSAVVHLLFDVAQGSVLGGPLFIMYVTPFAEATTTEGVQISQFSDDKQAR
jgi:hypothetical protein